MHQLVANNAAISKIISEDKFTGSTWVTSNIMHVRSVMAYLTKGLDYMSIVLDSYMEQTVSINHDKI